MLPQEEQSHGLSDRGVYIALDTYGHLHTHLQHAGDCQRDWPSVVTVKLVPVPRHGPSHG